jgi:hypothetical protein
MFPLQARKLCTHLLLPHLKCGAIHPSGTCITFPLWTSPNKDLNMQKNMATSMQKCMLACSSFLLTRNADPTVTPTCTCPSRRLYITERQPEHAKQWPRACRNACTPPPPLPSSSFPNPSSTRFTSLISMLPNDNPNARKNSHEHAKSRSRHLHLHLL